MNLLMESMPNGIVHLRKRSKMDELMKRRTDAFNQILSKMALGITSFKAGRVVSIDTHDVGSYTYFSALVRSGDFYYAVTCCIEGQQIMEFNVIKLQTLSHFDKNGPTMHVSADSGSTINNVTMRSNII